MTLHLPDPGFTLIVALGLGLPLPLLIRFVFRRSPMDRWPAIGTGVLLWCFSYVPLTFLGRRSFGAMALVALLAYAILTLGKTPARTPSSMAAAPGEAGPGQFSVLCRWLCSAMLAAPLLYWWSLAYKGDPVILLALYLLSLLAGLALLGNSVYCLYRYRNRDDRAISIVFLLASVGAVVATSWLLPGWKM